MIAYDQLHSPHYFLNVSSADSAPRSVKVFEMLSIIVKKEKAEMN